MMNGFCKDCKRYTLLTKHSEVGGHAPGFGGYVMLCRECHDIRDNCIQKEKTKKSRSQKGSDGKRAKGTRRHK